MYNTGSLLSEAQVAQDKVWFDDGSSKEAFDLTPIVCSLKGSLRDIAVNKQDYRQNLEDKYL